MLTRLRSRGGAHRQPEPTDDDIEPTITTGASQRPVLGDVSNRRQSQTDAGCGKITKKQAAGGVKKLKISTAAGARPGVVTAPFAHGHIGEQKSGLVSITSAVSQEPARDVNADLSNRRPLSSRISSTAAVRRATRASSRTDNNNVKRAVKGEPDEETRNPKRAKIAKVDDASCCNDVLQTKSQFRANAQDHRPDNSGSDIEKEGCRDGGEFQPRSLTDELLVPSCFQMQRNTYNGVGHTHGVAPHDLCDQDNILKVAPYVTDLFQYFYRAEARSRPEMYMHNQADINAKMRAILVDWLVEVHMKFRLVPETLYLCVNIIDRYCSQVSVARSKLQLVGVTALLIACKYEEIYPPEVRDCVYITDRAYKRQEVLDMEQDMLQRLRFKITVPTAYPFLQRFLNITKSSQIVINAANYYMERTLQEHELLRFKPSVIAASCVILALNNPDIPVEQGKTRPGLSKILIEYTGFEKAILLECANLTAIKVGEEPVTASRRQLVAVKRKYDNKKFQNISMSVKCPNLDDIVTSREGSRDREYV